MHVRPYDEMVRMAMESFVGPEAAENLDKLGEVAVRVALTRELIQSNLRNTYPKISVNQEEYGRDIHEWLDESLPHAIQLLLIAEERVQRLTR